MKNEFVAYTKTTYPRAEMISRAREFYLWMDQRRTVREFSSEEIPEEVIDNIILTASTAPSGAHKQPWSFCVVRDPEIKNRYELQQRRKNSKATTDECRKNG